MNTVELIEAFTEKAKVYDLEHIRYAGMPAYKPASPGLLYYLFRHHLSY